MKEERKTIILHGVLEKQFGKVHKLVVKTPLEAVRALCCTLPNFRQEFAKYNYHFIKGTFQRGWGLTEQELGVCISNDTMHFIPVIAGSASIKKFFKKAGKTISKAFKSTQLLAGLLVIGLAFTGAGATVAGWLGTTTTKLAVMGGLLVAGGLANLNAKTPSFSLGGLESVDSRASMIFNGAVNTTEQGNARPIVYGRMRVGSQVISQGVVTQDTL